MVGWISTQGATINWTNTSGGSWNTAANWSPSQVPGASDSVFVTSNGTYTITLSASAQVANLTLGGASGSQQLTVSGSTLSLTNGTIGAQGILRMSGSTLNGVLSVKGVFDWTNGVNLGAGSAVTIQSNAVFNLGGNGYAYLYGALTNAGTVNLANAGDTYVYNYAPENYTGGIVNLAGALFNIQNDQTLASGEGSPSFNNAGTVLKSAGVNSTIGLMFTNTGVVDAASGTLAFNSGCTAFSGSSFSGAGTNLFNGGTLTANGSIISSNLVLAGATLSGNATFAGVLTWMSGSLGGASSMTIPSNTVLNLTGNSDKYLQGILTNAGTVNWSGTGNINLYDYTSQGYDGAIINLPGAVFNIQNDQTLAIGEGSPFFNNAGTVLKSAGVNTTVGLMFTNTGVVDAASGTLAFNSGFTAINGSIFSGAGTNLFNGGTLTANGSIIGSNLVLAGATLIGNATFAGVLTWMSGTLAGASTMTIPSNAVLNLTGNSDKYLQGVLTNAGTVNWSGTGNIDLYYYGQYDGAIINLPGALFNVQNDQTIANEEGSSYFYNEGTFLKSAGVNTTIGVLFTNGGVVNVASGTLTFNNGATGNGSFTGAGNISVTSGTLAFAGAIPNLIVAGGTANGANASISNLTLSSGGIIEGVNTVTATANWAAGALAAGSSLTVASNAVLNITGNVYLYGILTNGGTVNWSGSGNVNLYNYAPQHYDGGIVNLAGALFNVQNDETMADDEGSSYFYNAGTFLKSAGVDTTISLLFTNVGVVDVASGTLTFNNGGLGNGSFIGAGNISVTGGTLTLGTAVPNLIVAGGTINGINASISNLTWSSGILQGDSIVTTMGIWTGGTLGGESSLTVATNAVLDISGNGYEYLYGVLTNAGTVNWSSTGNLNFYNYVPQHYDGGIVNLAGALFNVQNDQTLAGDEGAPYFNNAGTFLKSSGTNTAISLTFNNTGTMSLDVYNSKSAAQINFSGSPVLAGAFNVNFNSPYSPATGDSFPLLTYSSEAGVFSSVSVPLVASWQTNIVTYGATVFNLAIGSIYKLAFTSGPSAMNVAGVVFAPIVVQAQYLNGSPLATNGVPITIALISGNGKLSGTTTQNTDATGQATFNDLSINLTGAKALQASSPPWITPTTNSLTIIPAAAAQLLITTPIAALQRQGYRFSPAPKVQALDQFGNVVSNSTILITAQSSSGGGGTLRGATGVNANGTNGVATFGNLYYNLGNPDESESVVIYFTSPGLVSATNGTQVMVDFVSGRLTLTNGNSSVEIDPTSQNGVSWTVDGSSQLYQQWFWLRQDPSTAQVSFDQLGTPLGISWTSTNAVISYLPAGLNVTLSFTLKGGAKGSHASGLAESISIQNTTNSSMGLHLYEYADFDLDGQAEGDTVSFPATNMVVQQGKELSATQTVEGQTPSYWEGSWYSFALDAIQNATPAILSDQITPNQPGDQTFAYQWDFNLAAGQTYVLNLTNNIQTLLVPLTVSFSGTNATIAWPSNNATGFNLQSTAGLSAGNVWEDVATVPSAAGGYLQVTLPITTNAQFFRLKN